MSDAVLDAKPILDRFRLDGCTALVTGAGQGIGRGYAHALGEAGAAVAVVDTDVLITDSDSAQIASATLTLTNPQTDDLLLFNGTPPTGIGVSGSGTSQSTLTGAASPAAYQTALRQITFDNTSKEYHHVLAVPLQPGKTLAQAKTFLTSNKPPKRPPPS